MGFGSCVAVAVEQAGICSSSLGTSICLRRSPKKQKNKKKRIDHHHPSMVKLHAAAILYVHCKKEGRTMVR